MAMKKAQDIQEYKPDPSLEYAPLPDEYLQNGGTDEKQEREHNGQIHRKHRQKRMLLMTLAFAAMVYVGYASGFWRDPNSKTPAKTEMEAGADTGTDTGELPDAAQAADLTEQQTGDHGAGQTGSQSQDQTAQTTEPAVDPEQVLLDRMLRIQVYHDTYDMLTYENEVLAENEISAGSLLNGESYQLPECEPVEGYTFLGWVARLEISGADYILLSDQSALTAEDLIAMASTGNLQKLTAAWQEQKDTEPVGVSIHAAWRKNEPDKWSCVLILDANGGALQGSERVTYAAEGPMGSGCTIYLCAYPVPVREGYRFTGWYPQQETQEQPKNRLSGLDFFEKDGDDWDFSHMHSITLYAGWKAE